MRENFYLESLYPLQDEVLQVINAIGTEFYLTGGTALSRCFLNHRFSDDLDFFVNDSLSFKDASIKIEKEIDQKFDLEIQHSSEKFRRMMVRSNDVLLKLEFINDVPFHYGSIESSNIFNKVDNLINILSNKITAVLDRDEAKDFCDIFAIANHLKEIDWRKLLVSASSKSAGIFAPLLAERLFNFDFERLGQIKWNTNYDWKRLKHTKEEIVSRIIGL